MDLGTAAFLTSARGHAALAAARATRGDEPLRRRAALEAEIEGLSAADARAALAQDDLREKAAAKTPLADVLLFTKEALEQATTHVVAAERARRFAGFSSVADLGAGIGLDTLALANAMGPSGRVVAVERDPIRAGLLRWNAAAAGVSERVAVLEGDAVARPPAADAAFLDPDRRPAGRRTRDASQFEPPKEEWEALVPRYRHVLVKLPPATRPDDHREHAIEWVSLDGEMKEARLGFGDLSIASDPARRRALLLPRGVAIEGAGVPWPEARAPREGDVLLDPDPAIVLAGLVGDAAATLSAHPIHPRIAYLLAGEPAPWARSLRVDAVLPADPTAIRLALDARGLGDVEVLTRGVDDSAESWRRRIGAAAGPRGTVVVTRDPRDRYVAMLVSR